MKKETLGLILFIGGAIFGLIMVWGLINKFFSGNLEFTSESLLSVVTQLFWIGVGLVAFLLGKNLQK